MLTIYSVALESLGTRFLSQGLALLLVLEVIVTEEVAAMEVVVIMETKTTGRKRRRAGKMSPLPLLLSLCSS
jgi:hypothetical protein